VSYLFRPSPNFTKARGREIDLIVIHTMEIDETPGAAEACAAWFARPDAEVSAHYCVDADTILRCVADENIAWHARGGNGTSIGIELAGWAGQARSGWSDPFSNATLDRASALTAELCLRYRIPVRWLRAPRLRTQWRGITGHADISEAFRRSDHWDPGPSFPIDRFLALVAAAMSPIARRSNRLSSRVSPYR
jgi:N-acetyl-anhydromuramyl-L-alanine amidase AmpD